MYPSRILDEMKRKKNKRGFKMADEEIKKEEEAPAVEETKDNETASEEVVSECDTLRNKVKELEEEIADLKDKALREAAETENYKKRLRQEKENAVKFANEALIRDLLDPLDNFARAIEASEKSKDFDTIRTGVVMVEDQIHTLLKNNWGLEAYSPEGEDFNPADMEACMMQEVEGLDKEKVLQVFVKGYKLHGKVIRAAKVVVGKPKSN